jgi:Carbohydrate binding module (family 6)
MKFRIAGKICFVFLLLCVGLTYVSMAPGATTQTIAAGTSQTNLQTETAWPGAQDPPYICCWIEEGQFVTFTFTVSAASTALALRYSAGNTASTRKIELDGAVLVANESFPRTVNWSTWSTITLNETLGGGTHTLTIIFDLPSGSSGYLNLDNLTITQAAAGATQTIAASKAQTNLQTESIWPGAQDPPYICCWIEQGQYVTFTFTVGGGSTDLALRYSAGSAASTRKIELDGAELIANQTFPRTANWSTWAALTLNEPLTAGTHTLTIIFDAPSGSSGYLNLDILTITQAASTPIQTIAAGKSQTDLQTESTWPGAQDPPYICCWIKQGQFVTFAFTAGGGPTNLVLRYSAGSGAITRKVELDGVVFVANQTFQGTSNWSTWTTLALNQTLSAAAHTLTVIFDSTSGSAGYLNLDNLTVSQGGSSGQPPDGVVVSLGYADDATGLTPWSGSANTIYIGDTPQCCATHGPDNGSPGYDGGAIEITNSGSASVTVNTVSVDFGGGSTPANFALWGGKLPQTLPPNWHLVMAQTIGFNFDTSDLFGEACHINSGVVPVVHITVNGSDTDYLDDHQILNSDGADLASCPGDVSEQKSFQTVSPGAQSAAAPVNDVAPAQTGPAIQNHVLSGIAGAWNASPPPTLASQWIRCDSAGGNCSAITGATSVTYRPGMADVGSTLRFQVKASNASGTLTVPSLPTAVIAAGAADSQLGDTSTGFTSTYVLSTLELSSIFTAASSGTTSDFEFFARGAGGTQVFTPKVYSVANGAKGALLATGVPITVPMGANGTWYVSAMKGLAIVSGDQYLLALDPSGTKSTYVGSEIDGTMAFFLDYAP